MSNRALEVYVLQGDVYKHKSWFEDTVLYCVQQVHCRNGARMYASIVHEGVLGQ